MKIVIIGLGYVGITAAACLSSTGHEVIGVDTNEQKVASVMAGESPITEPGIEALITAGVISGALVASTSLPDLDNCDLVIVCVGTPSSGDGSHNMGFIAESTRQIAVSVASSPRRVPLTIAFRSTFKPGTMEELIAPIFGHTLGSEYREYVQLVYNPEFLRESTAIRDYFEPPKIVVGTEDGQNSLVMDILHADIHAPQFVTQFREAEITKFIDNTWHAVKVAFANEVGRICDAYQVNAEVAHNIFVSDTKLNISAYYTRPGGAFGGSCLPKDVRAMQYLATHAGLETALIGSVLETNKSHQQFQLSRVMRRIGTEGRVLVAGLAFKAGTDDMRESPNVALVEALLSHGYRVRVFDPAIEASGLLGQNLGYILSVLPTLRELLISAEDFEQTNFDLVVANNASSELLPANELPVLNLQTIST